MLYSIGKDSSVLLRLAMKAFAPGKPPFPLLHVDTTWKFREMIAFREQMQKQRSTSTCSCTRTRRAPTGDHAVHARQQQVHRRHEDRRAEAGARQVRLRLRLRWCAARRGEVARQGAGVLVPRPVPAVGSEEPAARAVEPLQRQDQPGREHRVFPISNWTELDVWLYIYLEKIPVPSLYFAKRRARWWTGRAP
jgi:sulfate adenylyltransferase subunit 2